MSKKINAYIRFKDNCREAMNFYKECFGGELTVMLVKDSPMKDSFPPHMQDIILHSSLDAEGFNLLGSEIPGSEPDGYTVSLMIVCDSKDDAMKTFEKLGAGGEVVQPIETFFAGTMGNLKDKFGMSWGVFSNEQ